VTTEQPDRPILLVEDDETLGNLLARHLRAHGHQVTIAGSTEETITALERGLRPSLVLLDINLPGETGWSVLRSPAFEAVGRPPVVVASAMAVSPARLREFGVAGYLPKPFALDTLRSTIDRLLTTEIPEP
jgi:DNA-binding response OmpR family regulator